LILFFIPHEIHSCKEIEDDDDDDDDDNDDDAPQ